MTKTKLLLHVIDSTLASTARTVRAVALILVIAVAAGPLRHLELPLRLASSASAPASTADAQDSWSSSK
jgi:hypothetical protein